MRNRFSLAHAQIGPLVVVTTVRSWHECLSTRCSPEVPSLSQAVNFPSSLRAGFSCSTPRSPSRQPISISKPSSSISVSTLISSNNSSWILFSSPFPRLFLLSLSLLLSVMLIAIIVSHAHVVITTVRSWHEYSSTRFSPEVPSHWGP